MNGLVGDGGYPGIQGGLGQLRLWGQVQISEKDLVFVEKAVFQWLGLFDLHDHIRGVEYPGGLFLYDGSDSLKMPVGKACAFARMGLDQYPVAVFYEQVHLVRGQRHPVFLGLGLFWDAYNHQARLSASSRSRCLVDVLYYCLQRVR